jgi:aspartyl/asparaginyl beta-hydroxylase (cupin superfamily)
MTYLGSINEPRFWDPYLADAPIVKSLKENFESIRNEVLAHVKNNDPLIDYPKYKIVNPVTNNDMIDLYDNYWKAFPVTRFADEFISDSPQFHSTEVRKIIEFNKQHCPTVDKVVKELEEKKLLANAFVSRLIPGSILNPHRGWSNNWMRIHICLKEDPGCVITVGGEQRTWKEGEILAFKDGGIHLHSVKHNGTVDRIILSVDVNIQYLKQFSPELAKW